MHQGYIKLWRRLQDNDLWKKEKFTRGQAWIDLIMLANHKDGHIRKRGRIELKRGDIGWSERELSKRWRWSRDKTRRFLRELCSESESKLIPQTVPQQNKNITSCYSVVNYETYQGSNTANCTTNRPQTDHKQDQNKNVKNDKNDKNDKNKYSVQFLEFYSAYPLKKSKAKAFKS